MNDSKLASIHDNANPVTALTADPDIWFEQKFSEHMQRWQTEKTPSMSIVVTKGTLDWAYPPFILASTAAALGWEVALFFTFYGLDLLKKDLSLKVSPLGNPAMPMKMPFGPRWVQAVNWKMPNAVMGNLPGFESMVTSLMKKLVRDKGVASVEELREACLQADVEMIACQMTVELFGLSTKDFIPEVREWVGAASFLPRAQQSDVSLFI